MPNDLKIGETLLASARNIVSATIATIDFKKSNGSGVDVVGLNIYQKLFDKNFIKNENIENIFKNEKNEKIIKDDIVGNEIVAGYLILQAVDAAIRGFLPADNNENIEETNDDVYLESIIYAAENRLKYLKNKSYFLQNSADIDITPNTVIDLKIKDLDVLNSSEYITKITKQDWQSICAIVASKELDALLRLRVLCKGFIIALSSSL